MPDVALNISLTGATKATKEADELAAAVLSVKAAKEIEITTLGTATAKADIESLKTSLETLPNTFTIGPARAAIDPLATVSAGSGISKRAIAPTPQEIADAERAIKVQERSREILFRLGPASETAAKGMLKIQTAAHGATQVTHGLAQASQGGIGAVFGLTSAWTGFQNLLKSGGPAVIITALITAVASLIAITKTLWATLKDSERFHAKLKNDATASFDAATYSAKRYAASAADIEKIKLESHANSIRDLAKQWQDSRAAIDRYHASQASLRQAQQNTRIAALDLEEQKALATATPDARALLTAQFSRRREDLKTGYDKNEAELTIRDTAISRDNQASLITAANRDWEKRSKPLMDAVQAAEKKYNASYDSFQSVTGMDETVSDEQIKLRRADFAKYRDAASQRFAASRAEDETSEQTATASSRLNELNAKLVAIDDFLAARSQYTAIGDEFTQASAEHTRIIAEATQKIKDADATLAIAKQNRDATAIRAQVEDVRTKSAITAAQDAKAKSLADAQRPWQEKIDQAQSAVGADALTRIGANFGSATTTAALDYARRSAESTEAVKAELKTLNRKVSGNSTNTGFTD